jgi:FAD/FMN-containing dehydrogenase
MRFGVNKTVVVGLLFLLALLMGWLDTGALRGGRQEDTLLFLHAALSAILIFLWFRQDAHERGYQASIALQFFMLVLSVLALPWYFFRSRGGWGGVRALAWLILGFVAAMLCYRSAAAQAPPVVNDVTQINPIQVAKILKPHSIEEVVAAVKGHAGPVSIGGGRFSMGGQTATDQAVQLDMREFDKVVAFDKAAKEITVQTGITWRKIQEHIDPHDLSLRIMQTYANFTVGGSLSVNVHGRYVGLGPLVLSVKSIRIVLADGRVLKASPAENREIFYGAIGGYGAMGVIVEATLMLDDNVRVERQSRVLPLAEYRKHFFDSVRNDPNVVFHNADIYPEAYDTVRATSYLKTGKPATVGDRLMPKDRDYWKERLAYQVMSEWPFGRALRQFVIDPVVFRGERVEWRNYEASYDVKELEPASRAQSTYVLQEFFVPVEKLEDFVPRMAEILNRRRANVINVSIRHARQDPGTLLAWARSEVFAFVLYYKQGVTPADRKAVGVWTRELVQAAIDSGGAYYLPYQIHPTDRQFHAAYPRANEFFALKKKLDPTNKFRNRLWDAYYRPAPPERKAVPAAELAKVENYKRDEAQTYLTLPEWYLVYSPDEYARYITGNEPSGFPYGGAISQFWGYYWDAYRATKEKYGFNWGYHAMVFVIGTSYTAENILKGAYENVVGRLTEWFSSGRTQEDDFAARVQRDYVAFIRVDPWYEYSFAREIKRLWRETSLTGPNLLRKWERKLILSLEYAAKAQYAMLIKFATKAAYGDADDEMLTLVQNAPADVLRNEPKFRIVREFDDGSTLLSLPRYEEFREAVLRLSQRGVKFQEIAGNKTILVTAIVPDNWRTELAPVLFERPILTAAGSKRVALNVPVERLHQVAQLSPGSGFQLEHVYDY